MKLQSIYTYIPVTLKTTKYKHLNIKNMHKGSQLLQYNIHTSYIAYQHKSKI